MTSYYPELDHCSDYHYYFYNITTPYINPYTNDIYVPNGGHSSISKVSYTPNEALYLSSGTNWISIPRHDRDAGHPEWTLIEDVFHQDNFTGGSSNLDMFHWHIEENNNGIYEEMYKAEWEYEEWTFTPEGEEEATRTYSTRGYKLDLNQSSSNSLIMTGTVEPPGTYIDLYPNSHNWVGYFLYQEQDIFDALGLVTNYLLQIESGNGWSCTYQGPYRDPGSSQIITEGWDCTDEFHTIDYGEMVELTTEYNVPSGYNFVWQLNGQPVDGQPRDATEHFTYTETADYTPVYVLLDSTANPSELATYVNDSCVGGCIVLPGDTMVGILAYLDGQAADSITFEEWYNTKSTARRKINSYSVYNPNKEQYEQRSILLGENREYYKVSFRKINQNSYQNDIQNILTDFWIYPNPSSHSINIEYRLHSESLVSIEAYDIYGRSVADIANSNQSRGIQHIAWNLKGNNGQQVCSGIYTINIVAGGETITRKVVIN